MDFFEAQERARKRTHRLVVLFVLAVLGTVLIGYAAAWLAAGNFGARRARSYDDYGRRIYATSADRPLFDPRLFILVTAGTLATVGLASLYKWSQMRDGGAAIAALVGGRRVDPKTIDLKERQLLNVVEEMAIASGIPMPDVFLLDDEPGLNAFAAGLTTSDAAVTVTRGALDKLSRDELQGVIGHEFSHILNGDMRLNVRITAIVFGILVIGLLGRGILQTVGRGRGRGKGGGVAAILALGLALLVIGYVGYFFGKLIQAAVSRQREFLADASAVQFTRNPPGVTGALSKIGGYALGGTLQSSEAGALGHFFFAQAFESNFGGLWATHPPLEERIRAIDPQWNGKFFAPATVVDVATESSALAGFGGGQRFTPEETVQRVFAAAALVPPASPPVAPLAFKPAQIVSEVGALTDAHFRHAQLLLQTVPTSLREAVRDPATAQTLVYGLLLGATQEERDQQQRIVEKNCGAAVATALAGLRPALSVLDPVARLPLLQLSLPALKPLAGDALHRFVTTLDELVQDDGRVTPFEFAVQKMLQRQLSLARAPAQRVRSDSFDAVRGEIAVVLSALAQFSPKDSAGAFAEGAAQIPVIAHAIALLDPAACGLAQLDDALDRLAASSLPIKQRVLVAAGHVIAADGTITVEEGELFRVLAATLDLPMPSLGMAA